MGEMRVGGGTVPGGRATRYELFPLFTCSIVIAIGKYTDVFSWDFSDERPCELKSSSCGYQAVANCRKSKTDIPIE